MKPTDKFKVGSHYLVQGTRMDVVGRVRLSDFVVVNKDQKPIIRVQYVSYFFNWKRLINRYEIAWALRRVFEPA